MTLAAWFEIAGVDRAAAALALHEVRGPVESMLVRRRWSRDAAEEYVDRAVVELFAALNARRENTRVRTVSSSATLLVSYVVAVAQRLRGRDKTRSVRTVADVACDDVVHAAVACVDEPVAARAGETLDLSILTPPEREAWNARASGESQRAAAMRLGISRGAFRERIAAAERRVLRVRGSRLVDRGWALRWAEVLGARGPRAAHRTQILALHGGGATARQIGSDMGMTPGAVRQVLHRERCRAIRENLLKTVTNHPPTRTTR